MVPALTGPVLVGAALLAVAAPGKWRRPASTANALQALGLPGRVAVVRLVAVGELALAAAVAVAPSPAVLGALGVAYLAFGGVVTAALRRGTPLSSCGCFGRPDTPPTRLHLAVVVGLAAAALAGAGTGSASLAQVLATGPTGLALLLAVAVGTFLAWAVLAVLPQVAVAARAPRRPDAAFRAVRA